MTRFLGFSPGVGFGIARRNPQGRGAPCPALARRFPRISLAFSPACAQRVGKLCLRAPVVNGFGFGFAFLRDLRVSVLKAVYNPPIGYTCNFYPLKEHAPEK
jgi:hypothetical protein